MPTPIPDALKAFRSAVKGLRYSSERDAPLTAVLLTESDPLAAVAKTTGQPVSEIQTIELGKFLAPMTTAQEWHTDEDKAIVAGFRALQELLEGLEDASAFRVGSGVDADVYVVGKTSGGRVAGFRTKVTET